MRRKRNKERSNNNGNKRPFDRKANKESIRKKENNELPFYQRAIEIGSYFLLGFAALNAIFDPLSNSFNLISPSITYIGTILIIVFWIIAWFLLWKFGLIWVDGNKQTVIRQLKIHWKFTLLGMIVLLWVPRLADKSPSFHRLQVKVETGRDFNLNWANTNNKSDLPDLVTVTRNGTLISSYNFFNIGKSSKLKDYPWTMNLFERRTPTNVDASVVDLDKDGNDEVILQITNKLNSVPHEDGLIAGLILNSNGEIILSAPTPSEIPGLGQIPNTNPYSAYHILGELIDSKSSKSFPVAYVNYIGVKESDGKNYLLWGWVVDSACYACPHVQQIDAYEYVNGQLRKINELPMFWYDSFPKKPAECDFEEFSTDPETLLDFLEKNNLPSFNDIQEYLKNRRKVEENKK